LIFKVRALARVRTELLHRFVRQTTPTYSIQHGRRHSRPCSGLYRPSFSLMLSPWTTYFAVLGAVRWSQQSFVVFQVPVRHGYVYMLWNTGRNTSKLFHKYMNNNMILYHLSRRHMEKTIQSFNVKIGSVVLIARSCVSDALQVDRGVSQ